MAEKVVITGLGLVTSLGTQVEDIWSSILEGKSGIAEIKQFDTSDFAVHFGGEVKDFDITNWISKKEAKRLDRYVHFAAAASLDAVKDSGLDIPSMDPSRIGVVIGSGIGGIIEMEEQHTRYIQKGASKISPFIIPKMMANSASGNVSILLGASGPNFSVVTACAAGSHSIGQAADLIRNGLSDVVVTGGSEAAISPLGLGGFCSLKALSTRNDDPTTASRPFDQTRDGFVMAEAGGTLILESESHAKARGAKIYAELAGFGMSGEGYHITQPNPDANGCIRAMDMAIKGAGLELNQIDYINAHGTSTYFNDKTETFAVKQLFGDHAHSLAMSSVKSHMGHSLGASGAVEAAVCALALRDQKMPPTINLNTPDPECDLDYVPHKGRDAKLDAVISNSLGFGGHNACLCLKKYNG